MNFIRPENFLLRNLPTEICRAVLHQSEIVHLDLRESLIEPNMRIDFVDFPESGVMSVLQPMTNDKMVEVANIGNEGMVGVTVLFDVFEIGGIAFCQVQGKSNRIATSAFIELMEKFPLLRETCQRYVVTLLDQISRNTGCSRTHPVESRCARWLLATHDRCQQKDFVLTQEFLALMLSISRTNVNEAAGKLAKEGLITYVRGKLIVLDREGLEKASCPCYFETLNYYYKIMTHPYNAILPIA